VSIPDPEDVERFRRAAWVNVRSVVIGVAFALAVFAYCDATRDAQTAHRKRAQDVLNLLFAKSMNGNRLKPSEQKALDRAIGELSKP
jgi:hypothetical protein